MKTFSIIKRRSAPLGGAKTEAHGQAFGSSLGFIVVALLTPAGLHAEAPSGRVPQKAFLLPLGAPLSVAPMVTGTPPLTYQWLKDNKVLSSAKGAAFTVSSVKAGDAGTYRLKVSNASGRWESPPSR